jgi:hypothetical protein
MGYYFWLNIRSSRYKYWQITAVYKLTYCAYSCTDSKCQSLVTILTYSTSQKTPSKTKDIKSIWPTWQILADMNWSWPLIFGAPSLLSCVKQQSFLGPDAKTGSFKHIKDGKTKCQHGRMGMSIVSKSLLRIRKMKKHL